MTIFFPDLIRTPVKATAGTAPWQSVRLCRKEHHLPTETAVISKAVGLISIVAYSSTTRT